MLIKGLVNRFGLGPPAMVKRFLPCREILCQRTCAFYRYIKPWLLKSLQVEAQELSASLAKNFSFAPTSAYFLR
jgi:molybdopterin molybdotransferase